MKEKFLSHNTNKNSLIKLFVNNTNSVYFNTSFSYSLLNYFLKTNKIYLNKSIIYKIMLEEQGTYFSLINWLLIFYKKIY